MRISRIHLNRKLIAGTLLQLEDEAAHYAGRVLRLRPGDGLSLFNDADGEYLAEVVEAGRQGLTVRVLEPVTAHSESGLKVHLGLCLSRGERMDYAIQKATELGVVHITPLLTAFSEVRLEGKRLQNRLQHWQRVCISACEQSGRSRIPTIDEPQPLNAWVEANRDGLILDGSGGDSLSTFDVVCDSVCLLVGPEGGFDEREIQSARDQGYRCVRLGPRVLRTETAPVVGLALLQYLYGDLGER